MKYYTLFALVYANALFAAPSVVVIMRNAEPREVDRSARGLKKKERPWVTSHLSVKGQQRAQALVPFFMLDQNLGECGKPVAIFAQGPSKPGDSLAAANTVKPLADTLGLKVQTQYSSHEYNKLVRHVMQSRHYNNKPVVISFDNCHIPLLAKSFKAESLPREWDGDHDRLWLIYFDKDGHVSHAESRSQKLLFGDSEQ